MMTQHVGSWKLHNLQRIAELLIYLFAFECVLGGSGRFVAIGSISIRMIFFALAFIATLPFVWIKKNELIHNPTIIAAVVFGASVLFSTILGFINGNALGFIRADLTGFLTLALLPGMAAVLDSRKKLYTLIDVVFYASVIVAVITTILHIGLAWMDNKTINAVNDWINAKSLGGFAMLATHLNRVYFRAQIFLQFSLLIGVWKIGNTKSRAKNTALFLCEGIMLFAVIASYTRSFWVGFAVSAFIVLVLEWRSWKKLISSAAITGVLMLSIAGISTACYGQPYVFVEIVNRFDSNLIVLSADKENDSGTTDHVNAPADTAPSTDPVPPEEIDIVAQANQNAVTMRKDSLAALSEKISAHPVLGSGLGTNLDGIREDGKTEYMYRDILMKMGVTGLILFGVAYFMTSVIHIIRRLRRFNETVCWQDDMVLSSFIVGGYIGIAVTSAFNPFLTTPMGILILIITNLSVLQKNSDFQNAINR